MDSRCEVIDAKIRKLDQELLKYKEQMAKQRGPSLQMTKQRAMQVLKQKKMYEGQRNQMMQQQFNIDQQQFVQQSMQDTVTTVNAMKAANVQIQKEFKGIDLGKIEDMQDDMEDLFEQNQEIQEVMSRSYGGMDDVCDADLEAELADLENDPMFEDGGSYLDDALSAPTVPSQNLPAESQEVDEFGLPAAPQRAA
eukprot:TRINITY_DN3062_c0_g1_i3.p1 TRINITY_DN3062_c0_g1~~TRINITY_DN3062_c0_g1_i3.p1  ORF type:complete len:195 (-),score=62.54 TRINITY_DN3062_c0_g1_i3:39-623(-)